MFGAEPSTISQAIDTAARHIWLVEPNCSVRGNTQHDEWDFDNYLTGVDTNDDSSIDVSYGYDALKRRVSRTDSSGTQVHVQAGQQTIADYNHGATPWSPNRLYVWGSYVDEPILHQRGSTISLLGACRPKGSRFYTCRSLGSQYTGGWY